MSHNPFSAETLRTIRETVAALHTGSLRGYADREDLVQDTALAMLADESMTIADAVRAAYNANREERNGNGARIGFAYLSQTIANGDDSATTIGDMLADTVADSADAVRGADAERAALVDAVRTVRNAHVVAAHGAANAARGAANGARGVANDAAILAELEAVGGAHYGYAAKIAKNLRERGLSVTANAVRIAVNRAKARTEGGAHSSRD